MINDGSHYLGLAAAYCRGRIGTGAQGDEAAVAAGLEAGLRLHRFKRTAGLPRVRRVIGALRGLAPSRLLDLGTGRGVFLWRARVHLVYLETGAAQQEARNRARRDPVPAAALARMVARWSPPRPWEAHRVTHVVDEPGSPAWPP